jgi:redox-sensitive bicupin YhaK (pirin superfamily)
MVLLFALVCDELLVCGVLVCAATTATHPKPIAKIVLTRLISASLFFCCLRRRLQGGRHRGQSSSGHRCGYSGRGATPMSVRPIKRVIRTRPTIEGAGVKLERAFGFGDTTEFDPFLLLDDFRNENPDDYVKGFPWHPHRGIETITYVLAGSVEHGDSLGNRGSLGAGDVQWMTAGRGILHQEMPRGDQRGRMHGFQLWANLASSLKMTAPRYQDVLAGDIPEAADDDGTRVRVICGAFAYVFAGSGTFRDASDPHGVLTEQTDGGIARTPVGAETGNRSLVLFDRGDEVVVQADDEGIRFLLVSGRPIEEPVAWYGPIVMNTDDQLQQAFTDLRNGTFITR